ncbi:MAG: tryptophan synthase subunit alpha [Actinobacteria bacterium]|nr:tryptophan synthase subunit alpha [Actinomycetota bacterium]
MNGRQQAVFARAAQERRAALIGYFPAGFPSAADSVRVMAAMVRGGVDLLEVGLPYSDPLMDGPVIQAAVESALRVGATTDDVLVVVDRVSELGAVPLVMSYWNPIERYGLERFATRLGEAGGVGVITPDLTPEEAGEWIAVTDECGIGRTFLVAPSSTDVRIERVSRATTGFLYAASTMGVTGVRDQVSDAAPALVERVRTVTDLPVGVGLGVSTEQQAASVAAYADGVIVGSAFVRAVQEASDIAAAEYAVEALSAELARGVRT